MDDMMLAWLICLPWFAVLLFVVAQLLPEPADELAYRLHLLGEAPEA